MDKMGESSRAGNRGTPATPRIGAPIEITALLKSTLRWVSRLHSASPSLFPFSGVKTAGDSNLSYAEWDALIMKNFDSHYFIPENPDDDPKRIFAMEIVSLFIYLNRCKDKITKSLVNRRGIYKDVIGSTQEFAEYQLRPNQCVALAVAPELFPLQHANSALKMVLLNLDIDGNGFINCYCLQVEEVLIKGAPLGVRTLDPADSQYCGDYYNTDGHDHKTAGGFNYHNGPEWVWPLGYFLEARIHFHSPHPHHHHQQQHDGSVGHGTHRFLRQHRITLATSPFRGLPELTNSSGAHCAASCEVQAWSSATILSALHQLHHSHSH